MPKVYPNAASSPRAAPRPESDRPVEALTVWRKSLLFSCKGFTVFDAKGNLVFRVDKYLHNNRAEILLMDATGNPVFNIRKKKLALGDNWVIFNGETTVNPIYQVKKNVNFMNPKILAYVTPGTTNGASKPPLYQIEGSYSQRCCKIYDDKRKVVAEIKRKETAGGVSFGVDVFRLVVQPDMDPTVAMALVVLLEQMFA